MNNIITEEQFIEWIDSLKDLNKAAAIKASKILEEKGSTATDLGKIAADPGVRDEYARQVMFTASTNTILSTIFNGLMGTMPANEMTEEQNRFLNSNFEASVSTSYSLEDKQRFIRDGELMHGMRGDFYPAPLFNRYSYDRNHGRSENDFFNRTFSGNAWPVEKELFLPEILGVQEDEVLDELKSLREGRFPVELSPEGRQTLFNKLCNKDDSIYFANCHVDKEISAGVAK